MQEASDNELIENVAAGCLEFLGPLFDRHHQRVHSLCYRMTGDSVAADDLVQESFLRVLRYAAGFGGRASFSTWLYRIARNVCIDYLNSETRTRHRLKIVKDEMEPGKKLASEPENPRIDRLREALYRLPPDRREVLVLSRYEGLSYAEIAEVCQTTVGAIKVRAHRALRDLRRIFEELEQRNEV